MDEYTVTVEKTLIWKVTVTAPNPTLAEVKANDLDENQLGEPDSTYWSSDIFD